MKNGSSGDKVLVLVVDDDPTVRLIAREMAEMAGYRVAAAADGDEAMRRVSSLLPDLVLLDIQMPGVDGYTVCRELRRSGYANPVILMSGNLGMDTIRLGHDAGATDFLGKPFNMGDLEKVLRRALGGGRSPPR